MGVVPVDDPAGLRIQATPEAQRLV
ncbi:uncharacterized protein METZ01_LOCUS151257 [marine metagenome]|uniref:Uncharacterized protein n=1 Tax=marine metagenome TaxID=408172 RepID=A0A382ABT7_9ZZZZ